MGEASRPACDRGSVGNAAEADGARSERLTRDDRLRRSEDFRQCYQHGRKAHGSLVNLFSHRNQLQRPRLGVTASRRVGNSVVRHLLRRRVKEVYRRSPYRPVQKSLDLVFHLKPMAFNVTFKELAREINRLLKNLDGPAKAP